MVAGRNASGFKAAAEYMSKESKHLCVHLCLLMLAHTVVHDAKGKTTVGKCLHLGHFYSCFVDGETFFRTTKGLSGWMPRARRGRRLTAYALGASTTAFQMARVGQMSMTA
eukprot:1155998-Pelagomonas_calceolata.AAC.3